MLEGIAASIPPVKAIEPMRATEQRQSSFQKNGEDSSAQSGQGFQRDLQEKMKSSQTAPAKLGESTQGNANSSGKEAQTTKQASEKFAPNNLNPSSRRVDTQDRLGLATENWPGQQQEITDMNLLVAAELGILPSALKERHPILKFMDSMENELGIEPDRLVAAFAALPDQALTSSPKFNTEAYLDALKLEGSGRQRAKQLYGKMLNDLQLRADLLGQNPKAMPEELQALLLQMDREPVGQERLGAQREIERMTRKFFDVYPNQFGRPKEVARQDLMASDFGQLSQEPGLAELTRRNEAITRDTDTSQPSFWQTQNTDSVYPSPEAGLANLSLASLSPSISDAVELEAPEWLNKLSELQIEGDAAKEGSLGLRDSGGEFDAQDFQGGNDAESFFSGTPTATAKSPLSSEFSLTAATASEAVAQASTEEEVSSLVKNVGLLTRQGGGEMKLQLQDEALGEMHLKVAVQEGKVNIQLLTDTPEAKKYLEADLGALKAELNEKKIDLAEIKVEVAKDLRNELQNQLSQQQREQTRQFWQQFRDESDAQRAMAMNRGIPTYNQRRDPTDVSNSLQTARSARRGMGTLDVVA